MSKTPKNNAKRVSKPKKPRRRRSIEQRIANGEAALKEWGERFTRRARIEGSPFTVSVSLLRADPAWALVEVTYSAKFAGGVSARGRIPLVALIRAGELARELKDLPGAGGDPRIRRCVPPPRDEE